MLSSRYDLSLLFLTIKIHFIHIFVAIDFDGLTNIIFSLSLVLPNGDISLATLAIGDADSNEHNERLGAPNGTVGNCEETIQTDS